MALSRVCVTFVFVRRSGVNPILGVLIHLEKCLNIWSDKFNKRNRTEETNKAKIKQKDKQDNVPAYATLTTKEPLTEQEKIADS